MKKVIELSPIKETSNDFEELEGRIKYIFRKMVYLPLLRELKISAGKIENAKKLKDTLTSALRSGRIIYSKGGFFGDFNASISRQLKEMGAQWDKQLESFRIPISSLTQKFQKIVRESNEANQERIDRAEKSLAQISPAEIADKIKSADVFDKALWKMNQKVAKTLEGITIIPKLTTADRKKIADEWQNNMNLWINDFAEEEIPKLRAQVQAHAFSGGRYGDLVKTIQKSYETTAKKAKFLARQETNLLMAKYKETRYTKAGVMEYRWGCVIGTPSHPVRPDHRALQGQIFRWDDPPITDQKTKARNNPGQDYNCRCFAKPIVRFK